MNNMRSKSIITKTLTLQKINISKLNNLSAIKGGGADGASAGGRNRRCEISEKCQSMKADCTSGQNGQD